jgi:ATP-dependent exoDNAse (exonuclease V) beta subunit
VTSVTGGDDQAQRETNVAVRVEGKVGPPSPGAGGSAEALCAEAEALPHTSEAGASLSASSTTAAQRIDAGPAWGSLVHGLLEYAGQHEHAVRADFERLARWLIADAPELAPVVADAVDLVERVVHTPFWKDVRGGGDVLVEVPFSVRLAPGESLGGLTAGAVATVVQGVIDLVHRSGNGWRILDYKTDLASEDEAALMARHGPQLATYRAAWERTTGTKVTEMAIVALRSLRLVRA